MVMMVMLTEVFHMSCWIDWQVDIDDVPVGMGRRMAEGMDDKIWSGELTEVGWEWEG